MPRYEVTSTCNATVRTTYFVEAGSASEAERKVKLGDVEPVEEEVYGHQGEEIEVELIDPPAADRKASKSKSKSPSKKKGRS